MRGDRQRARAHRCAGLTRRPSRAARRVPAVASGSAGPAPRAASASSAGPWDSWTARPLCSSAREVATGFPARCRGSCSSRWIVVCAPNFGTGRPSATWRTWRVSGRSSGIDGESEFAAVVALLAVARSHDVDVRAARNGRPPERGRGDQAPRCTCPAGPCCCRRRRSCSVPRIASQPCRILTVFRRPERRRGRLRRCRGYVARGDPFVSTGAGSNRPGESMGHVRDPRRCRGHVPRHSHPAGPRAGSLGSSGSASAGACTTAPGSVAGGSAKAVAVADVDVDRLWEIALRCGTVVDAPEPVAVST